MRLSLALLLAPPFTLSGIGGEEPTTGPVDLASAIMATLKADAGYAARFSSDPATIRAAAEGPTRHVVTRIPPGLRISSSASRDFFEQEITIEVHDGTAEEAEIGARLVALALRGPLRWEGGWSAPLIPGGRGPRYDGREPSPALSGASYVLQYRAMTAQER